MHYLNTFLKKPGAVKNSIALKSIPKLKAIFDTYYAKKPRDFIEALMDYKDKGLEIEEIVRLFKDKTSNNIKTKAELGAIVVVRPISQIDMQSRSSMADYALLMKGTKRDFAPGGVRS